MRRQVLGAIALLIVASAPLLAQQAVVTKAVDVSTGATTDVGDATDHAIRVKPVPGETASASLTSTTCPGSGCVVLAFTQPTATVGISVEGTFDERVNFQGTGDGGTTYSDLYCTDNMTLVDRRTTTPGQFTCDVAGLSGVKVWATIYTSGAADVSIRATSAARDSVANTFLLSSIYYFLQNGSVKALTDLTIAGAPVAVGAGAADAWTQRTILADDQPPIPVDGSAVTQPVSAVSWPLPTGAATSALQTTGNTSGASIDTKTPALGQATMAASSPVAVASDQIVNVKLPAAVVTSGTFLTNSGGSVTLGSLTSMGSVYMRFTVSSATGPPSVNFDASLNGGSSWVPLRGTIRSSSGTIQPIASTFNFSTTSANEAWFTLPSGATDVRVIDIGGSAGATVSVTIGASAVAAAALPSVTQAGAWTVAATQSTAGSNAAGWWTRIGDGTNGPAAVKAASTAAVAADPALVVRSVQLPTAMGGANTANSSPVNIANDQIVPISAASLPLPAGAATSAKQPALGTAGAASADVLSVQGVASMTPLKVDGSGVTQPVNGTVTSAQGLPGSSANAWFVKIGDGSGGSPAVVKGPSAAAVAADNSLVTALSPNSPLPTGTNVIGHTINDSGSTTAVTGNVAVTQATAANLNATVVGTKTNNNAAPGATNIGNLPQLANAAPPSWTEGNQVAESVDLGGNHRVMVHPPNVVGCYSMTGSTGVYAGIAAAGPLFSARWGSSTLIAIIQKVLVVVVTSAAATTAGITERNLIVARSFTVSDSGGTAVTLTGNNNKSRTSQATSAFTDMRFATTAALTAGTRTLDANPVNTALGWSGLLSTGLAIGATSGSAVGAARSTEGGLGMVPLLNTWAGDYPIVLAQNEGLVVRIGVAQPAGSSQQTFVTLQWCEAAAY